MGFFSKKKEPTALRPAAEVPASPTKLKLLLRPRSSTDADDTLDETLTSTKLDRRVSTIVEDSQFDDFDEDDYDDGEYSRLEDDLDNDSSEDDDYVEHTHRVQKRDAGASVSQLSVLMGLCGLGTTISKEKLNAFANEEARRTYLLLGEKVKIHRLSPTMNKVDPKLDQLVISDDQVSLIGTLTGSLNTIWDMKHNRAALAEYFKPHKTLFDRYGLVKDVIGRGAYGVIKIIDGKGGERPGIYAVKELQQRPGGDKKETRAGFIERTVLEFILSSTLNNKNIVRTIDFLVTVPGHGENEFKDSWKISQVMECTPGGDLFSYCKRALVSHQYILIDEIDCMVKQIAKGLWYMHRHGVAHCDLKLENVLLAYDRTSITTNADGERSRVVFKISDFGKSNVVRTKWDTSEQLHTAGPIGSEPYMAPEEHVGRPYLLLRKDCWSLGVLALVLFNVRRSFYFGHGGMCLLGYYDADADEELSKSYGTGYLWHGTELRHGWGKGRKYKDQVFDEYANTAMKSSYDDATKEWAIQRSGTFIPIETLFDTRHDGSVEQHDEGFVEDDYVLRKYLIYKLLDVDAARRLSVEQLLKSDWLVGVECCGE